MDTASGPVFRPVVVNILNRWTALKIVVDHQMGGHKSADKALYLIEFVNYLLTSNQIMEPEELEDLLVEYMEREFSAVLEDDSPIEVAITLTNLYSAFTTDGIAAAEAQLSDMPSTSQWLDALPRGARSQSQSQRADSSDSSVSSDSSDSDEDFRLPGWTPVRHARKQKRNE